ncbi:MAG: cation-efflux pump [Nitrospiraceae bacterium]|nr:cation-efflux pump [Nitrospiraceae bacterium]
MESTGKKQKVALSSVIASFFLTAIKLFVGIVTGSIGIISEAAHSGLDFGAASLTYFAVRVSDKPADKDHHYGHAKVENVTALIATGLLLITSAWIIYEAVHRLTSKTVEVQVTWYSILVIVFSIIIDFSRARALKKVAKETHSQALEADALHFSSDILSSVMVLVGLVFVAIGWKWADAAAGLAVALLVAYAAFGLGKKTIDVLLDTAPEGITDQITEIAKSVNGVVDIEKIRVKQAGPFVFVEMSVKVSRVLTLENVGVICSTIENKIKELIPEADIIINTKPIALDCETIAERVQVIGSKHNLNVHDVSADILGDKKHIAFDVEVAPDLTIKEAHDVVSTLEKEIKNEFDGDLDISVHIDPLPVEEKASRHLSPEEDAVKKNIIIQSSDTIEKIKEVHDIQIRKTEKEKLFISLHCSFEDNVILEEVHSITSRLERLIYEKIPNTSRVVIHAEPLFAKE